MPWDLCVSSEQRPTELALMGGGTGPEETHLAGPKPGGGMWAAGDRSLRCLPLPGAAAKFLPSHVLQPAPLAPQFCVWRGAILTFFLAHWLQFSCVDLKTHRCDQDALLVQNLTCS